MCLHKHILQHSTHSGLSVLQVEVLVREGLAENGLAASAVALSEVAALVHRNRH